MIKNKIMGRLAPSPTGKLHLGNAWAFLCAWLGARKLGGELVLRIEDIDPLRSRPEYIEALQADLRWLGLEWDYGPGASDALAPYLQNERLDHYEQGLKLLQGKGLVYPCFCTRKELREMAGAPQAGGIFEPTYGGRCKTLSQDEIDKNLSAGKSCSLRMRFGEAAHARHSLVKDLCLGEIELPVQEVGGDFPLRRSDGVFAYQLAVVLDDIQMGVTQVVRGVDILASTPRQSYLYECFGAEPPRYAHVPLLLDYEGERLAKRHGSLALSHMRKKGVKPEEILGWLAAWSGIVDSPSTLSLAELLAEFDFSKVRPEVSRLPQNLAEIFPALG